MASSTITDEQFAARELVRTWAASSGAIAGIRAVDDGDADAWRGPFAGLAELGIFGVAIGEDHGGAGGTIEDLCAMVSEAARALIPGPVATTALATLVIGDSDLLESLAAGERTAGLSLTADLGYDETTGLVSGTAATVLGADAVGLLLLPAGDRWLLVDGSATGVDVAQLTATDFSVPLASVKLTAAPATVIDAPLSRVQDLAVTVFAAEAAGIARWTLDTATEYAKVREQFGKPIGSFQAIKHMCAEMLCRSEQASVTSADAARAAAHVDGSQLSVAAAVAAAAGIGAAEANARTAFRCSAASVSPGSTTRICTFAAPTASAMCWAVGDAGCGGPRR